MNVLVSILFILLEDVHKNYYGVIEEKKKKLAGYLITKSHKKKVVQIAYQTARLYVGDALRLLDSASIN